MATVTVNDSNVYISSAALSPQSVKTGGSFKLSVGMDACAEVLAYEVTSSSQVNVAMSTIRAYVVNADNTPIVAMSDYTCDCSVTLKMTDATSGLFLYVKGLQDKGGEYIRFSTCKVTYVSGLLDTITAKRVGANGASVIETTCVYCNAKVAKSATVNMLETDKLLYPYMGLIFTGRAGTTIIVSLSFSAYKSVETTTPYLIEDSDGALLRIK